MVNDTFHGAYALAHLEAKKRRQPIIPGCYCDVCKEQRAIRKKRKYLRMTGRPSLVTRQEADEAIAKLSGYHDQGMTRFDMGAASGGRLNPGSFADWINRVNRTMNRRSYEAIMDMPYQRSTPKGSRVPMHGSMRRLNALRYAGWPCKTAIADLLDIGEYARGLGALSSGKRKFVFYNTHLKIKEVYEKHIDVDPVDWGVPPHDALLATVWAMKCGAAPAHCWDEDTIDDPEAIAEWTGLCGTARGYRIHIRQAIRATPKHFACVPCLKANTVYKRWPNLANLMGAGFGEGDEDDAT